MATTKTKMDVAYLKTKVEDAKKKYVKQHAVDTAAYNKAKVQYDKEMIKYHTDLLAQITAGIKAGTIEISGNYGYLVTFSTQDSTKIFHSIKQPNIAVKNPGELNTKAFDLKLAILEGCSDVFIAVSIEDRDWSQFLV